MTTTERIGIGPTAGRACWIAAAVVCAGSACGPGPGDDGATAPVPYPWRLPAGFPTPVVPEGNPMTEQKVTLGRYLFHDVRLSGTGTQGCASCHNPEHAFAEAQPTSIGSTGERVSRNAPGLANAAYYSTLTWSSRLLVTFEQQMLVPMFGEQPQSCSAL